MICRRSRQRRGRSLIRSRALPVPLRRLGGDLRLFFCAGSEATKGMNQEPTIHIAIADDHLKFRRALAYQLERSGLRVIMEATNGSELIAQLHALPILPDICVVDVHMPVMDGMDTASILRREWPDMGILSISMDCDTDTTVKALQSGADAFIEKGTDPAQLVNIIKDIYGKRKTGA